MGLEHRGRNPGIVGHTVQETLVAHLPILVASDAVGCGDALNPVIDADPASPTAAVARSVLLIIAPGTPPALVGTSHITQYLRGDADGWRITRRRVEQ